MTRLAGKAALITGAGRGIGRAFAEAYVAEGARVALADIDAQAAKEAAGVLGDNAIAIQMDVACQDSIEAGRIACIVAFIAILVFMGLSYGLFGLFANVALIINVGLIFGLLSSIGATLTLPGIAGIVLTIGMAVDANVLIFERIREESRAGRSVISAIDAGYSRALGTILDANITTLIAAVILFQLGSGPVRGFAVTLAIGIFTTVFSAFTFSRLLVALWIRRRRPSALPI